LARRERCYGVRSLALAIATTVAVAACGSGSGTGPVPCSTYTGGKLSGNSGDLPGTYTLKSLCQGMKPDLVPPDASGTVTLGMTTFTASITNQGTLTSYSGAYATLNPDAITITLTSPLAAQIVGTFRLRNDSLAVSGSLGGQSLSLVGTRVP
jgi:hypothetical protein